MAEEIKTTEETAEVRQPEVNTEQMIAQMVADRLGKIEAEAKAKAEKDTRSVELVSSIEVGDELNPRWAKDAALLINAGIYQKTGESTKYERAINEFTKRRSEITEAQKRAEMSEAMRIVKEAFPNDRNIQTRTLSTLTNAAGGFLLPKPFLAEIFVVIEEVGDARRLLRTIPMVSKTLDLKSVATKPTMTWADENSAPAPTTAAFGEKTLTLKKLMGFLTWTSELQEDEAIGILPVIAQLFGEATAEKEDLAAFTGTGASAFGGFTGILNLAGAQIYTSASGSVEDYDFDDLSKGRQLLTKARRRNATWVMHSDIVALFERIKGVDGQYIYRRPQDGNPGTIWGDPVIAVDVMPVSSAVVGAADKFAIYGDFRSTLMGIGRDFNLSVSGEGTLRTGDDVLYSAFHQDGSILRVTERVAFQTPLENNYVVFRTGGTS
jgi:HK97 family phage major capsid protein